MAGKRSKKSAKVATKAAAKRVAAKASKPRKTAPKSQSREAVKPVLLSGGNPQIAKAYGDAPVQAYIAAMPGWKREVGRRLSSAPLPRSARFQSARGDCGPLRCCA